MHRWPAAVLLLSVLAACGEPAPTIAVDDAWTRASVGEQATAAVFMTIASPTPDRLVAASTPVAGKTDLMTMQGDDGAMAMTYLEAIPIPAETPVVLDPSGLHVWLADLRQPLKSGETFALTLEFEKAGRREVEVAIIEPSAAPPMSGMDM